VSQNHLIYQAGLQHCPPTILVLTRPTHHILTTSVTYLVMSYSLVSRPRSGPSGGTVTTRQTQVATAIDLTDGQKWLTYALLSNLANEALNTVSYNNLHEANRPFSSAARSSGTSREDEVQMKAAMFGKQEFDSFTIAGIGMAFKDRAVFWALRSGLKVMDDASAKGWADHLNRTFTGPSATPSSVFTASPYSPHPGGYARPVTARDVQFHLESIMTWCNTANGNPFGVKVDAYWDLRQSNRLQELYAPGGSNGITPDDPEWIRKSYSWINTVYPNPDDFAPGSLGRPTRAITDGSVASSPYGVQPTRLAIHNGPTPGTIPSGQRTIQASPAPAGDHENRDEDEDDSDDEDTATAGGNQAGSGETSSEDEAAAPARRARTPTQPPIKSIARSSSRRSEGSKKGKGKKSSWFRR